MIVRSGGRLPHVPGGGGGRIRRKPCPIRQSRMALAVRRVAGLSHTDTTERLEIPAARDETGARVGPLGWNPKAREIEPIRHGRNTGKCSVRRYSAWASPGRAVPASTQAHRRR